MWRPSSRTLRHAPLHALAPEQQLRPFKGSQPQGPPEAAVQGARRHATEEPPDAVFRADDIHHLQQPQALRGFFCEDDPCLGGVERGGCNAREATSKASRLHADEAQRLCVAFCSRLGCPRMAMLQLLKERHLDESKRDLAHRGRAEAGEKTSETLLAYAPHCRPESRRGTACMERLHPLLQNLARHANDARGDIRDRRSDRVAAHGILAVLERGRDASLQEVAC
mmetsp:Transcript_18708/g.51359  ORF Transcript_18708/g.51359 Transcript_18708/m.51359 type:complete len:225 (+) Transcript_18708:145-819(+)